MISEEMKRLICDLSSKNTNVREGAKKEIVSFIKKLIDRLVIMVNEGGENNKIAEDIFIRLSRAIRNAVFDQTDSPGLLSLKTKIIKEMNLEGDIERGALFGEIAVERGYTTMDNVVKALMIQKKEMEEMDKYRLIGEIMLEEKMLTPDQVKTVLLVMRNRMFKRLEKQIAKQYGEIRR